MDALICVCTMPRMQIRKPISVKLPPELLDKVDAYIRQQPHKTTRTQVIEDTLRNLVDNPRKKAVENNYENAIDRAANSC
jgi:metal-responsive CopG/Arc/MetJ family transcriptional regulator